MFVLDCESLGLNTVANPLVGRPHAGSVHHDGGLACSFLFIFHLMVLLIRHRPSNIRSDFCCRLVTPGCSCWSPWEDVGFSYLLLHRPIPLRLRKAACDTKPGQTRGQRGSRGLATTDYHSSRRGGWI
ncbi:hypothetical protein M752DRAFT_106789 [Aspergillus phoenicis ATCC 13157]|uniref:Uncharacterized protein n=1 Tax=Aspergillus phoenicis ATCC 13157 TaxID=1353007 RepID=A0A370P525_ASPPH|nr:hypothetical protein M752DRAFT_106789 [Aspergillus phoenicis ATCC 13157]